MRAFPTVRIRRIARPLLGCLAIFIALAMLSVTMIRPTAAGAKDDAVQSLQTTYPANAPSLGAVPDGPGAAGTCGTAKDITFTVAGQAAPLTNVEVSFNMTHTWVGDVEASLLAPGLAPTHLLFSRTGAATAASFGDSSDLLGPYNFKDSAGGIHFWTAAANEATGAAPVAAGDYRTVATGPSASPPALTTMTTTFAGLTAGQVNGTWTLRMRDCGGGDTGSVTAATLTLVGASVPVYRPLYDFTGDNKTDFTTLVIGATGSPITWKTLRNPGIPGPNNAFIRVFDYGLVGDAITPNDYIGDGKTEVAVWRSAVGTFFVGPFPEGTGPIDPLTYVKWGTAGDNLGRDGDYDGDGKDDYTVIRIIANQLQWHIKGSAGTNRVTPFGLLAAGITTFAFQGADFTGDGRDELVVAQVSGTGAATWFIGDSITGAGVLTVPFGNFNDDYLINPDDYNGDGLADIVVWRAFGGGADAKAWYIRNTATGTLLPAPIFGLSSDSPLRGNYDGDGMADIAVFRESTREWFWINSSTGTLGYQQWGDAGDTPLPNFFTF